MGVAEKIKEIEDEMKRTQSVPRSSLPEPKS
jgi:ribosome-interacting GTPase 1